MGGRLGRIGPYALVERLGRGGMGEVYLATTRRGERVAVKMLRDPIDDDPGARLRLDREVRALRRVESPFVAQVLDADLSGDRPYLVMEHIEGETLLDAVRRGGPLPEVELIGLGHGLAIALSIIHAAGVVHRDLKPANVLLAPDGPVLIDFGIAQVLDATRVTVTGTFLGTPGYAAPELFADEQVGEPADIHAWAATVAFAATGRPTFGRGTVESQMYAILHGQADLKGVPASLLPLVRAALNREPAKRPTAALLAGRLSRLSHAVTESTPAPRRARAAGRGPGDMALAAEAAVMEAPRAGTRTAKAGAKTASKAAASTKGASEVVAGDVRRGNLALVALALLAVPCVVASVRYPLATFAITATFGVLARTLWTSHWLVRNRKPGRARGTIRTLAFPLAFAGSLVSALAWPGVPAVAAAFGTLWLAAGTKLAPQWWTQVLPVTAAGVAFSVVVGGIVGREIERVGPQLPDLRREGLRALAVLGGFVALCAAAVRAVSLFV